jgi:tRNA modification GTPase
MELQDTITAISTPLGEGGIGIVRLSGKDALRIVEKIFTSPTSRSISKIRSHSIIYGYINDPGTGLTVDEVLLSIMRGPKTYTREDIVEINCHGGLIPLRRVLELTIREGARLAEPGEFTYRAFINGRIDLSQAEATIDLIRSKTEKSSRIAIEQLSGKLSREINALKATLMDICVYIEACIDFPEEDLDLETGEALQKKMDGVALKLRRLSSTYDEGRFFREGLSLAIVGRPNVGKSSLLNAFLERDRAIVTELPGTTRDIIEEYLNIHGLPIRIIDTAGIRETHNLVESEGVKRSLKAIDSADLILSVFDISSPLKEEDFIVLDMIKVRNSIVVLNKSDLQDHLEYELLPDNLPTVKISAKTGEGIEKLKREIECNVFKEGYPGDGLIITNMRHKLAIDSAIDSLNRASEALKKHLPYEIVAFELRAVLNKVGEIVGEVTTDDILNRIFSDFCIGK